MKINNRKSKTNKISILLEKYFLFWNFGFSETLLANTFIIDDIQVAVFPRGIVVAARAGVHFILYHHPIWLFVTQQSDELLITPYSASWSYPRKLLSCKKERVSLCNN